CFRPIADIGRGCDLGPMTDDEAPRQKFEEKWVNRVGIGFERWPDWLKVIFIAWTLLSIMFVSVDELHTNVPQWFGLVMVAPYLFIIFVIVMPAMFGMWLRWLTWPVRILVRLIRKK